MSLDKSILYGKEKRKPFRKSKSFDRSCRNHGHCSYCESNRKHHNNRRLQSSNDAMKDFLDGI